MDHGLSPRRADSHKGDFGRVLIVAGSAGMAGAAGLAGMACLRSGAGLVRVATAAACQQTVAGFEPSYMTVALPADPVGRIGQGGQRLLGPHLEWADVAAVGPGVGRSSELDELLCWMYADVAGPLVLDADGLNALAERLRGGAPTAAGPRVLTPHPGEFRRLAEGLGWDSCPLQGEAARKDAAARMAAELGCVVLLKGNGTVVSDGRRTYVNRSGNPGLATGGTGDVLTGVLAAAWARSDCPWRAACLAALVHGRAGDLAAEELGETGLIASDLLLRLPAAWRATEREPSPPFD